MGQSATLDAKALGKPGSVLGSTRDFRRVASRLGWGTRWESLFDDIYPGYNQTVSRLIIGGFLAFVDGVFDAYLVARLYNRFARDSGH